jgi:hypothetical protein
VVGQYYVYISTISDAGPSKRDFSPDSLMQNMMFGGKTTYKSNGQRSSVFEAHWGFLIHNPIAYLNQYGVQNSESSSKMLNKQSVPKPGTSDFEKNSIHEIQGTPSESNLHWKLSSTKETSKNMKNSNGYGFNPNLLNQIFMHMSEGNRYDMLKNFKQTNKYHGTSLETETNKKTETNTNQTHASVSNKGTSNKGSKSNHSSENQAKNTFGVKNTNSGYNIYKLNKPMLGNMLSESNVFGNTMFMEHGAMNKLTGNPANTKGHQTFHFDVTDLNSKMFNNVRRKHKRSSKYFNPNAMMNKYMKLRTNIDEFGSYHPNDLLTTINAFSPDKDKIQASTKFDPNGQSMFSSKQHTNWGFSVYNPLHSLEQYSGSNTGRGSSGSNTNTMSSGFNPNKLNDHLMSLLHQNIEGMSQSKDQYTGFNPDSLNNNLFEGLNFNPAVVNTKTVLSMFHEHIPMPVLVNQLNETNINGLPGLGNPLGHDGSVSSGGSANGYVKNTHSQLSHMGNVMNTNEGVIHQQNIQQSTVKPNTVNGYATNNHQTLQGHSIVHGQTSTNNGMMVGRPNLQIATSTHTGVKDNHVMFHGNSISQTGATNTAQVQATGLGSLGGFVQTNGDGYHQSMYQQGPTQGIINDTSVLIGSGGIVTQTQSGGHGSALAHLTGEQNSNNNAHISTGGLGSLGSKGTEQTGAAGQLNSNIMTQTGTGSLGSNVVSQTATGSLGSTSVSHTGTSSLGSNTLTQIGVQTNAGGLGSTTVSQTSAGGLGSISVVQTGKGDSGSNSVTQTSNGGLGLNTVSQTAAGGLGSTSVGQIGGGSLGSNTITQTNLGKMGSDNVVQTAAGSLGSTRVEQTGRKPLGSNTVSPSSGTHWSNSVTQTGVGTLGSNVVQKSNIGSPGSTSVSQISTGSFGPNRVLQTATGSVGTNNGSGSNTGNEYVQQSVTGSEGVGSNTINQKGVGNLDVNGDALK